MKKQLLSGILCLAMAVYLFFALGGLEYHLLRLPEAQARTIIPLAMQRCDWTFDGTFSFCWTGWP